MTRATPQADQQTVQQARNLARAGQFPELLNLCEQLVKAHPADTRLLLDIGVLLQNAGFITPAKTCFQRIQQLQPDNLPAQVNLANNAREHGQHAVSRDLYTHLQRRYPDNPVIRRNALVSLEYDADVTAEERFSQALAWGEWATNLAGGNRARPPLTPADQRPLRIGYVSADFCQHTVGLFVKDVLRTHDPARVTVFAYSAGRVDDWVTGEIRAACTFRDVTAQDDAALAALIRADAIDVLIDLSGHTAGSRLTVFAHRPAPVQVSWLGYFATTGLTCMDGVLLDPWHAPAGTDAQFVEPVIRLPAGRFCYQPAPWTPADVALSPHQRTGQITFGCFNNSAKLNANVFDVWAQILNAVPESRLLLKWRNFNDAEFAQGVRQAFDQRGIDPARLELRGPSFHVDVLKEYADIDIALDPFPFTGGLTSCEALWMGVPVITWPQSAVVSRQTLAFLSATGLADLAACDADDYVRIAVALANDTERLALLRATLRNTMQSSPLMDPEAFTHQLEQCLTDLYQNIFNREKVRPMNNKIILHVGPGHRDNGAKLPVAFQSSDWQELRLDADPATEPDIVGSMLDMPGVKSASVDAVYSAHNIEHVYAHEVPTVLSEFLRVLKPDGYLVVTCPDLQSVCALVAADRLTDAAYTSPAGPITPLDILYGHQQALAGGHYFMAHKCGFTEKTLTMALQTAGFQTIAAMRRAEGLDLWAVASKSAMDEEKIRQLAGKVLPAIREPVTKP